MKPIVYIAKKIGLKPSDLILYGEYKAKVKLDVLKRLKKKDAKLILVTAITPTPAGEGKTTTAIGLGEAFGVMGKKAIVCLREPSLGPTFGMKGGATGGGCSSIEPNADINLHFTGDIHAVGAANNLLAAMIDNHIYHGNKLGISEVTWKRCVDMNDRALRPGFDITAASEVMAILSLATDLKDLKKRLGKIIVGYDKKNKPVFARQLKAHGAMTALLKDALMPNLVQTRTNDPVFVHGGPFANIAHGCNSLIATKMALKLADYVVTEAGFGTDLGAEKFFNIKCRVGGLKPSVVVLVATVRALKMHGGVAKKDLGKKNVGAVRKGLLNLEKHVDNIRIHGLPVVVVVNKFPGDTKEELEAVEEFCNTLHVPEEISTVFVECGCGGVEVTKDIVKLISKKQGHLFYLYNPKNTIKNKIKRIATKMYGALDVVYTKQAEADIRFIEKNKLDKMPVCMAKTQLSLSDNKRLLGRPRNFKITIKALKVSNGAGFIVAYAGNIMTMPGLPSKPASENVDVKDGKIVGV